MADRADRETEAIRKVEDGRDGRFI